MNGPGRRCRDEALLPRAVLLTITGIAKGLHHTS
jgi:hypothetical protein